MFTTHFSKSLVLSALLSLGLATTSHAETATASTMTTTKTTTASATVNTNTAKKLNLSPIFIQLSDAMGANKAGDTASTKQLLEQIQSEFNAIPQTTSPLGQQAKTAISQAIASPNEANLSALSTALYAFEKEQNPVDYSQKRKDFAKKIAPAYEQFSQSLQATNADVAQLRTAYNQFNAVWLANERVVRNTSMGHYGKIETAMALLRVAIETQPINTAQIATQLPLLKQAIDSYNAGDTATVTPVEGVSLATGVQLLEDGLSAFQTGDTATGQAKLGEFINIWTSIEGDVSTRNPSLYSRLESQIPVVMASGHDPKQQANLQTLIDELRQINPTAQYSAVDSMLILLREGLEALLIIVALLSALNVAKQAKGKKYVYAGVGAGLVASIAGAVALQQFFPAMTSGANREMLEGIIGIVAVVLMIGIGAWLHSKSSIQSWNAFIKRHMGEVLTTGSFVSLFGLSFLSVFREGAETIIFYVGILPNITMSNFLLGIGMALVILAVVAWVMLKTSVKLPIPKLFKVLTWVIYFLGFKILGVSLSALQLTGHLSRTVLPSLPAIESIGFYPTVQTILAQLLYIVAIVALQWWMKKAESHEKLQVA
ncbi:MULTISPECIES: FTR1 family iron permease [unclassified Moraxella]|uniref:FTR1 family iron permease n=1 Tax=unclassified Moraxella TaxID=2685852 RepID=UPI003AF621C1